MDYLLTESTLDHDHCQINWLTLSLLRTSDQNDHSTKPMVYHMVYHIFEQAYEPKFEPVTNGH